MATFADMINGYLAYAQSAFLLERAVFKDAPVKTFSDW